MAFDDKNQDNQQGNQGGNKGQQNQGGSERKNPNAPTGNVPKQGQTQGAGKTGANFDDDQGEAPGQNQGQKQTTSTGMGATGNQSGNRGPGNQGGSNR